MRSAARRLLALGCVVALATAAPAVDRELRKLARDADSFKRSSAARALGKDGSPEAAELLLELLADDSPYVRDHAVEAAGKLADPAAIAALTGGARSKDALFRANLADALGRTASVAAVDALCGLAGDRDARVRAAVFDALWEYRDVAESQERLIALVAAGVADDEARVRAAAIEAAGRMRLAAAPDLVRGALADPHVGVRAVARMELRYVAEDEAALGLPDAAADASWQVRAQAVDDAFALRLPASVEALIPLLADERTRVAASAHRALIGLSGKELGRDIDLWRAWWAVARDGWEAPDRPVMGEPADAGATRAAYHGVSIDSGNVVFVLDASGSMREPVDEGTRWDLAVAALEQAVTALPDETRVNVIVFQETVRVCFDAPRALSKKARKDIASFAKRVSPGDSGDLLAGMLLALEQSDADTVFLLSDGAPSHGDVVDKDRVRAAIRSRTRMTKMVVNVVGLGAQKRTERSFLEGVTRDAGGRVVFR